MARAVSRNITGSEQDVLAGTVVGVLPTEAPAYDVEVKVSNSDNLTTSRMTLIVNGAAILENAWIPSRKLLRAGVVEEPRSDAPSAFFRAAAGSRLTLNINQAAATVCSVYIEARESNALLPLPAGKIDVISANAVFTEQDVLSGSPIGSLPTTAGAWNVSLEAAVLTTGGTAALTQDANLTLIIGGDTIAENFILPYHSLAEWPIEERDTLISTLAEGGDRITLNCFNPTAKTAGSSTNLFAYSIFANPVG